MKIICHERWLIVSFERPQLCLSWAVYGGGRTQTDTVAWYQVKWPELEPSVDPKQFLKEKLVEKSIPHAVGMLTGVGLEVFRDVEERCGHVSGRCVATVGMGNALRAGDFPGSTTIQPAGTINLLCSVSVPLSDQAHLEALSIAVEARTAAVFESDIRSIQTGLSATGTGTDCVVIVAPCAESSYEERTFYAGKHTPLGYVIGKTVFEAVSLGLNRWKQDHVLKEVKA